MGNEHYKNLSLANIVGEEWRDIEGFEGYYQVSNIGRVKSLGRRLWNGVGYFTKPEKIRKQTLLPTGKGSQYISVMLSIDGKHTNLMVGKAVYETFRKAKVDCIYHKNFNASDNRLENLYRDVNRSVSDVNADITSTLAHNTRYSKYKGIAKYTLRNGFYLNVKIEGKKIRKYFSPKNYENPELEAAKEYDHQVKKHNLNRELNFPDEK